MAAARAFRMFIWGVFPSKKKYNKLKKSDQLKLIFNNLVLVSVHINYLGVSLHMYMAIFPAWQFI